MTKHLVAAFTMATVLFAASMASATEHPATKAKPTAKAVPPAGAAAPAAPAAPAGNAPVVIIPDSGPGSVGAGSANDDDADDPSFDADDPNMGRDDGDGY